MPKRAMPRKKTITPKRAKVAKNTSAEKRQFNGGWGSLAPYFFRGGFMWLQDGQVAPVLAKEAA